MAPLAGRPPFATDEPESFYDSDHKRQPRLRQQPPPDPNNRTSAYDVYDSYLGNDPTSNRQSGLGAVGLDFLTGSMDDDDDDDDDRHRKPQPKPKPASPSKHAALAAATGANRRESSPPPPQYNIAAPRPGYAAPVAQLNLARPEPAANTGQQRIPNSPSHLRINPAVAQHGNRGPQPGSPNRPMYSSPSPVGSSPHPLQPPISPITPIFARPAADVKFAVPREKAIMRSGSEDALIPKAGGGGDDFWRRFSMVAKEENQKPKTQKKSAWLKKTQSGKTRMSRWVWIIGLVIVLCAAGGIGLGWYFSHTDTSHNQPVAIGGSAEQGASASSSSSISKIGSGTPSMKTSLHVSPTHTVDRRDVPEPRITGVRHLHRRKHDVSY